MSARCLFAAVSRPALAAMAVSAVTFPALAQSGAPPKTPVDPARLSAHDKVLASDAFEGRGPATPGEEKATGYIIAQFKKLGVPGGAKDGGYVQPVPLGRFEIVGEPETTVRAGDQTFTWTQGEDIAIRAAQLPVKQVEVKDAPIVFVGYGVTAPEVGWDDFKGQDVRGKMIVVLINDPDFEAKPGEAVFGRFGGKAMTYYGRWTYKYEEAARRGAAGVLIVHETAPASYGWATVKNSNTNTQFDVVRTDPAKVHTPVEAWIQRDAAAALFKAAGLDFDQLKAKARQPDFKPVTLPGASFSTRFRNDASQITSKNIVARIAGRTHPDETVIFTAHWDHLGVGLPDAKGDRIYNGAVDNADGIAALLELARLYAKGPKPQRSLVFLAVTAEEKGLLGSEYYAEHPIYDPAKTVADLNMDAFMLTGPAQDMTTSGSGKTDLEDLLKAELKAEGRSFTPDPLPEAGHFFRSDHFPMAKRGIPAISVGSGIDLYKGGREAGEAAERDYTANRYHQPSDEWTPQLDFSGEAVDVGTVYKLGLKLANSRIWPGWNPGTEFKAERDRTASERK